MHSDGGECFFRPYEVQAAIDGRTDARLLRVGKVATHTAVMGMSFSRRLAGLAARSSFFAGAREIWRQNQLKYDMPMSRLEKLMVSLYLVLADTEQGTFPPKFTERAETFERERGQFEARAGVDPAESARWNRRSPFWLTAEVIPYVENYLSLLGEMSRLGLREGDRVLELGCGSGWMSEFLAASGCHCVGTSISPFEIEIAAYRADIVGQRGTNGSLCYHVSAMEELDRSFLDQPLFDFVFIHAALHHAHSWPDCVRAVERVLKPGGWFLICNEPGILHTFVSYRVARLDGTHEIGMNRGTITRELRRSGYDLVRVFRHRWRWLLGPIWLAARKAA